MGNDELDTTQMRRGGHIIDTDDESKSPKSPPVVQFDENRNKKYVNTSDTSQKGTRFSFDRVDSFSASHHSWSPSLRRGFRQSQGHTPKRQPWLSRKSADWGANSARSNGAAAGRRRTEVMVVLMGASRVGKSAIVNQFLHNIFRHEYTATVDELHWIEYDAMNCSHAQEQKQEANERNSVAESILLLKIMDTTGSHEFIGMRKLYEQQGDAFILVVSVDDAASFEEARVIRQEIAERNTKKAPVICVLNKVDSKQASTGVKPEQVRDFALSTQCLFVEVTATEHDSVAEIFRRLLQQNSIVPSASHLKYRRKSVPISSVAEFGDAMAKKSAGVANKKCLKAINETSGSDEEKRPACVIC